MSLLHRRKPIQRPSVLASAFC